MVYLPRRPGDDDTPQLALATGRAPITPGVPRRLHFLVYYARDGTVPSDLWARIRLLDRIGLVRLQEIDSELMINDRPCISRWTGLGQPDRSVDE